MKINKNVLDLIGNTPMVKLNSVVTDGSANIYAKIEGLNPGGSVKDRIAMSMIEAAEKEGTINKDTVIVEPTSGNTGVGLSLVCAVKGYKLILTMPKTMTIERRMLLKLFGAELVLTSGDKGMSGAVEESIKIKEEYDNCVILQQFENNANPDVHYKTMGPEIWEQTEGKIDAFVAGIGTGGTITGAGRYLKEKNPDILLVGLEPKQSPLLTKGEKGPHKIQGIGAGFVPKVLNRSIIDEIITIDDEEALLKKKELAIKEGLSVGISSGAAVIGATEVAKKLGKDKNVVTVLPDIGERYLSMV